MRSGARWKRTVFAAFLGSLVALACGRSARQDDGAREEGSAGEGVGGDRSGTGGSSTGGSSTGGTGAGATGGSGGSGGSAGSPQGGAGAGSGAGGEGGSAIECVLAETVECCPKWVPATREDLEMNECIVAVGSEPAPGAFERCTGTTGCEVECAYFALPSRLLEPDENGGCRYADECDTTADCEIALDCCTCCACETPTPSALVVAESCLVPTDNPPEPNDVPPDMCQACPAAGDCLACTPKGETWSCNPTPVGPKRCEWGPPLTVLDCTNDRPCANRFPGENMRCYAPGDPYCAGPAPPPDECAVDVDCRTDATREHFLCEPSGHCEALECVPGCLADDDCSVAEVCGADHRCAPKPCSSEVCGNDHRCSATGSCQRRGCTTSADCGGYCVNGLCYAEPGGCADASAP